MGRKPKVQTRIPEDVKEDLDEYCEANDISQADAVRRAIEREYATDSVRGMARQEYALEGLKIVTVAAAAFAGAGVSL